MDAEQIYKLDTLKAISSFQMLEFSLKIYLATTFNIISSKVGDVVPFKYGYKDIENHSLEKLLNLFQKHNENTDLQRRLNKLRMHRNELAHKSLLVAHEELRDILGKELDESHISLQEVREELESCLKLMAEELDRVFKINGSA